MISTLASLAAKKAAMLNGQKAPVNQFGGMTPPPKPLSPGQVATGQPNVAPPPGVAAPAPTSNVQGTATGPAAAKTQPSPATGLAGIAQQGAQKAAGLAATQGLTSGMGVLPGQTPMPSLANAQPKQILGFAGISGQQQSGGGGTTLEEGQGGTLPKGDAENPAGMWGRQDATSWAAQPGIKPNIPPDIGETKNLTPEEQKAEDEKARIAKETGEMTTANMTGAEGTLWNQLMNEGGGMSESEKAAKDAANLAAANQYREKLNRQVGAGGGHTTAQEALGESSIAYGLGQANAATEGEAFNRQMQQINQAAGIAESAAAREKDMDRTYDTAAADLKKSGYTLTANGKILNRFGVEVSGGELSVEDPEAYARYQQFLYDSQASAAEHQTTQTTERNAMSQRLKNENWTQAEITQYWKDRDSGMTDTEARQKQGMGGS